MAMPLGQIGPRHDSSGNEAGADAPLSILLVDDDPMVREVTAWMLMDAGHTVKEASDGVAALDILINGGPVDLLITDINMPRMDGLELVQEIKARWPGLPVLLVSGRPQPPGTQAYMAKPFGFNALINALARVTPPEPGGDAG